MIDGRGGWHRRLLQQVGFGVVASGLGAVMALGQPVVAPPSDSCVHYWPRQVELRGRLARVLEYGPPNFGENPKTDWKGLVAFLHLEHPISMCADKEGEAMDHVTVVQVNFTRRTARRLNGKVIRVAGTLIGRSAPMDYADVIMTPDSVISRGGAP